MKRKLQDWAKHLVEATENYELGMYTLTEYLTLVSKIQTYYNTNEEIFMVKEGIAYISVTHVASDTILNCLKEEK